MELKGKPILVGAVDRVKAAQITGAEPVGNVMQCAAGIVAQHSVSRQRNTNANNNSMNINLRWPRAHLAITHFHYW